MNKGLHEQYFGELSGKPVMAFTIDNGNGMQATVINYGATITKIITPDKDGNPGNVILGFETLPPYIQNGGLYLGSIVGRYCNRIAGAAFTIENTEYKLVANNDSASLHGGIKGFDKVFWHAEQAGDCKLKLSYLSADGEEGFPGNLHTNVFYSVSNDNELIIDYDCHTDKPTTVNLTSHGYFNLSAGRSPTILEHELSIFADHYTTPFTVPEQAELFAPVENTALDFNRAKKVGEDILQLPNGYDHNYVLNKNINKAAELYDPASGRFMEVFTTEPGLQFYVGKSFDIRVDDINEKKKLGNYAALCLEAQHFPNSPNVPEFPSTILYPGDTYRQTTVYKFSVK